MAKRSQRTSLVPEILIVPFCGSAGAHPVRALDARERAALADIASVLRMKKGEMIYRAGEPADHVFNVATGAVKTLASLPNGVQRISTFCFAGDLFGLAEEGRYVELAQAVMPGMLFRFPLAALEKLLHRDAVLSLHLLCRLTHDLREEERHGLLLARHDAIGKIAMFIAMLERREQFAGRRLPGLHLPMSRSDIADYAGLSAEAVSRAFAGLKRHGIVSFGDKRHFRVADRAGLNDLITGKTATAEPVQAAG